MKCFLVLLAIAVCFSAYAATDSRSGAWTAEFDGDTAQITIFRSSANRDGDRMNHNVMGFNETIDAFSGLSKADVASNAANVKFELRRPAGTILFDGRFSDGTGAGHFRFTPSDAFIHDMESLGYSGFNDDQLLILVMPQQHGLMEDEIAWLMATGAARELENVIANFILLTTEDAYAADSVIQTGDAF